MAGFLSGEPSHYGAHEISHRISQERPGKDGGLWYFSRKEIEENSPSRQDGIDLKKESYLRKSYCTFLQDLGMRLKVPQVTIATAIIFCHRFFLGQSHAKNDSRTIATVCMFLAGKVEETPRPLKDVILVSYEIIHKKDAAAVQRIKQKEVYEQQKELILQGEKVVLATLGFDLNLQHPYKTLVEAIKKFQVAQNALAQVAWNFVNDGLRTSLCLQFKPHHIAAGAIFLAAKFLKVKLPSDGDKVWWQEFDVTPRQLEVVSNQMLELYEQNRVQPSEATEAEESAGGSQLPLSKGPSEGHGSSNSSLHCGATSRAVLLKPAQSRLLSGQQPFDDHREHDINTRTTENNEYRSTELNKISDCKDNDERNDIQHCDREAMVCLKNFENKVGFGVEGQEGHSEEGNSSRNGVRDPVDAKDKFHLANLTNKDVTSSQSPHDAIKKLNREKVRAALERRKARGDITHKMDHMDELERELEDVEVPGESEKFKHERKRQKFFKPSNMSEHGNSLRINHPNETGDVHYEFKTGKSLHDDDYDTVEEGEVELFDDLSPRSGIHKKKAKRELDKPVEGKAQMDHVQGYHKQNRHDYPDDRNGFGRLGYSERGYKRNLQENHA